MMSPTVWTDICVCVCVCVCVSAGRHHFDQESLSFVVDTRGAGAQERSILSDLQQQRYSGPIRQGVC